MSPQQEQEQQQQSKRKTHVARSDNAGKKRSIRPNPFTFKICISNQSNVPFLPTAALYVQFNRKINKMTKKLLSKIYFLCDFMP
jgi:5-methylcytosine-specific restriction endonuclease McrA